MNRAEYSKNLHPAISHINAGDEMSEELLEVINSMADKVSKMDISEIKKLIINKTQDNARSTISSL